MRKPVALVITSALLLAATPSAQSRRAIAVEDLSKLHAVSDPQVSPDCRWVAYAASSVDVDADKRDTDLWMVSWDGTQQIQLTSTKTSSESQPRWSPDNRYLAFLTSRGDADEKKKGAQVWLLDRRGGEAQQLTSIEGGVSSLAWSPDSTRLVVAVSDPDPRDEPEKLDGWKRKTEPPIVIDRYHFKQDIDGYLQTSRSHLSLVDVASKKITPLTSGKFDDDDPSWSPDGKSIAYVSSHAADPDRNNDTQIFVVSATAGAEPRQVTTYGGANSGPPAWSPDGRSIAYLQGEDAKMDEYALDKLAVVPAAGGAATVVTTALDRPVAGPLSWTADGRNVMLTVVDDRITYLASVQVAGGHVERTTNGREVIARPSRRDDSSFAVLRGTATQPDEVYAWDHGTLRQLTHQNDTLMSELALATTEDVSSKSKDGTDVHSVLVKPADFKAGQRYPMLLLIHGGPNAQDQHSFSFDRQFFAAHGYVVLSVNYRGSNGRGVEYSHAIAGDWGPREVMDLLGAVDAVVASGVADPDRLGVGGWSYGGILTDQIIAADTRFKAAVSGAGVANLLGFYGVDQYILQYDNEIGPPWKSLDTYLKISAPFLHADRIKTPTLFMGGEKDFNVPINGGEQMYQALRSLGVDTQLVIYPAQFHGLTTPSYQRDRLTRYLGWYDKYLKAKQ